MLVKSYSFRRSLGIMKLRTGHNTVTPKLSLAIVTGTHSCNITDQPSGRDTRNMVEAHNRIDHQWIGVTLFLQGIQWSSQLNTPSRPLPSPTPIDPSLQLGHRAGNTLGNILPALSSCLSGTSHYTKGSSLNWFKFWFKCIKYRLSNETIEGSVRFEELYCEVLTLC